MIKNLIDLHTHTTFCNHAYSTFKENLSAAKEKGLEVYGWSEHGYGMPNTTSKIFFKNLRVINREIDGIKVLIGMEANILDKTGKLIEDDEILKEVDYVIASLHTCCYKKGDTEDNTQAMINAIKNPYVKILGHPDDGRYPVDHEKVVLAAKKENVIIEVNNSSFRETSFRKDTRKNMLEMLKYCKKHKVEVLINSDAHIFHDVGNYKDGFDLIKKIDFPEELILNDKVDRLKDLLAIK
ncbi:MAG: phosphatase [Tissierellia bacterium]|nr:phosphatase [Tissierellia bacterium]